MWTGPSLSNVSVGSRCNLFIVSFTERLMRCEGGGREGQWYRRPTRSAITLNRQTTAWVDTSHSRRRPCSRTRYVSVKGQNSPVVVTWTVESPSVVVWDAVVLMQVLGNAGKRLRLTLTLECVGPASCAASPHTLSAPHTLHRD